MSGIPPTSLATWKAVAAIFISLTGILLIEKIYSNKIRFPLNIGVSNPLGIFPGWASGLRSGESQTSLLHKRMELHKQSGSKKEKKKRGEDLD
ncbi:hypothetical protein N7468_002065 [Penicillium chermesinum]|uniref:Uncharacterized protein n=1 Tax=Penicillium chermesinum TaxID=63820 RepID=A0A9W9PJ78_9EURO|nr:uncharacterized protein N7468_002065 [Penicillium chermesinum]KAJ5247082.1 hypothetical protein N7468_002065 [Penicillium chermesinum]KAJ6145330.1 hypothetical protein N7470_009225 [Penicillium chermesinum]